MIRGLPWSQAVYSLQYNHEYLWKYVDAMAHRRANAARAYYVSEHIEVSAGNA